MRWVFITETWHKAVAAELDVHTSTKQFDADIQAFIMQHNDNPRPYKWTKSTDEILASVKRFCHKTNQTSCGEP
jgi:hypothetical protein